MLGRNADEGVIPEHCLDAPAQILSGRQAPKYGPPAFVSHDKFEVPQPSLNASYSLLTLSGGVSVTLSLPPSHILELFSTIPTWSTCLSAATQSFPKKQPSKVDMSLVFLTNVYTVLNSRGTLTRGFLISFCCCLGMLYAASRNNGNACLQAQVDTTA